MALEIILFVTTFLIITLLIVSTHIIVLRERPPKRRIRMGGLSISFKALFDTVFAKIMTTFR